MKVLNMMRLNVVAAFGLFLSIFSAGAADSLFKDPVISVTPRTLDFGSVAPKTSVTNSFLVENWGGGKLVGKATVPRPFKVLSGGSYRLGPADAQVVTISYTPSDAAMDTNVVKFSGGGGAIVPVVGKVIKKDR